MWEGESCENVRFLHVFLLVGDEREPRSVFQVDNWGTQSNTASAYLCLAGAKGYGKVGKGRPARELDPLDAFMVPWLGMRAATGKDAPWYKVSRFNMFC